LTRPGPPKLSPPDPAWADTANRLIEQLKTLVSGEGFVWDHIGSTSVPGLAAKPFIDLQLGVPSLDHLDGLAEALSPAGFVDVATTRPGSPGVLRDMVRGNRASSRWDKRLFASEQAILHVRQLDSAWWHYTIRFRDLLRTDTSLRQRYQRMKLDLAAAHGEDEDYDQYTLAKTAFFDAIQDRLDGA
jgi:dephospho-CoA kinase